jgi:hypothetical protein
MIVVSGCGPRCVRGHYEKRHVSASFGTMFIDGIPIPTYTPAHEVDEWVCDEHEKAPR